MKKTVERLFELQDLSYKEFHCRLMPNIEKERVIGVRTPALRALAAEIYGTPAAEALLKELPHSFYEENNLHAFLIAQIKNIDLCIAELNRFLPFIDNWATCDMLRPRVFAKNKSRLLPEIKKWLCSDSTYTVRFAIEMLMVHFLDADFKPEYAEAVAAVKSEDYYIMMMKSWYFATALAKQCDCALPYITERRLDRSTHNKAISKAVESRRISDSLKTELKALKC